METLKIKRTRLEVHECNECEVCKRNIKEVWRGNECAACKFIFFEKLYKNFSSGNKVVDKIIKNPIYIPPKNHDKYDTSRVNYYKWVPWERLSNIIKIGKGGFGIIYKAIWIDGYIDFTTVHNNKTEYKTLGEKEVAIKFMNISLEDSDERFKELNIIRTMFIEGSNLVYLSKIIGITQNAKTLNYGIVMEFAKHGDMRKYLSTNFYSTGWYDKLFIATDIATGLIAMHSSGIAHRDLHSGNILQHDRKWVQIGDLGFCQPTNNEATTGKPMEQKKIYGVIPYIPPEVLRGEKFTTAGDIYSYGMLLWELATGKPPFHDFCHNAVLIIAILNGKRPEITSPLIPPCYAKIIEKCWDDDPKNRPTAEEVVKNLFEIRGFSSHKPKWLEFFESDKFVREMRKNHETTKDSPKSCPITTIHPGAVYTSRLLTLQLIKESNG
ncbi:hypothetical protein G9A89_003946 [Geosiphon pyriformis]|nr:hypothetical protein G9A89_003946 [Geosiphon pyriformis]